MVDESIALGRTRKREITELTLEQADLLMAENGGSLDLNGAPIVSIPDGLVVGGGLNLSGTFATFLPEDLLVGGSLYLRDAPIKSLPEGLMVGGTLDLRDTDIIRLPGGLTVGGHLDLRGTGIKSLPEDLLVGGEVFLPDVGVSGRNVRHLTEGDYVPGRYVYADSRLVHVASEEHFDGYVFYVGKIRGQNVVTDGKRYVRCGSIRDGIAELDFMAAKEQGKGQYKRLPLDTTMPVDEARTMYRIITGFRRLSAEDFIVGPEVGGKDRYTIRELLDLTGGRRVHESFWRFFRKWKPPMFGDLCVCATFGAGQIDSDPNNSQSLVRVKNLSAQEGLTEIAHELVRRGYTVETVEALQGAFTQYVVFRKTENEIFVVESSDTFEIDDIFDLPDAYFHVGRFEKGPGFGDDKSKGYYGPWFFATEAKVEDIYKKVEENAGCVGSTPYEDDARVGKEYEKWKSNKRCVRISG